MKIAVLGLGVIGRSWALAFLASGLEVWAWDPDEQARLQLATDAGAADNLALFDTPSKAVEGAEFVQESGPERVSIKRDLLNEIRDAFDADAIYASSTSTITASELQQDCPFAGQILIGHPFNPPHLVPLVEVVAGKHTTPAAVQRAMDFYRAIGKYPVQLRTERPGHLANRLQAALWREAVDAVASGQASIADVDAALTHALGPRWSICGPFATFDLAGGKGGLSHFLEHLGPQFEGLWDDAQRPEITAALAARLVQENAHRFANQPYGERVAKRNESLQKVLEIAEAFRSNR